MLTPEERAAIAAFPVEKIQIIPRGQSGIDIHTGLPKYANRSVRAKWHKNRRIDEKVRVLCAEGLTEKVIAQTLKLSLSGVKERKRRLGLSK